MAKMQTTITAASYAGGYRLVSGRWVLTAPPAPETGPDVEVIDGGTP